MPILEAFVYGFLFKTPLKIPCQLRSTFCEIFNHCIGATPSYSTGGVNQMWILQEIYKDLLRVHIIKVPLHLYFKLILRKIGKPNN